MKFTIQNGALVGVKLLCETDFVAKNDSFSSLVDQLLSLIAAQSSDVQPDAVPESLMDSMTTVLKDNAVTIGENMRIAYVIKRTGQAYVYNHMGNTIAAAVFYTGDAEAVAKDCALQVAAMNPLYVSIDNVDPSRVAQLTQEFTEEVAASGKPAEIVSKIVEGKVQKALQDDVLLEQVSIKEPSKKVKELFPQGFSITDMIRVSVG